MIGSSMLAALLSERKDADQQPKNEIAGKFVEAALQPKFAA